MRTQLTAATTFYVSPSGSDSNDGLTLATAWLTLQHAWDTLFKSYDLQGFAVTVLMDVAGGYYSTGLAAYGTLPGSQGPSSLVFSALNPASPPGVLVAPSVGSPFVAADGAAYTLLDGIDVDGSISNADCISIGAGSEIALSAPGKMHWFRNAGAGPFNHASVAYGGKLQVNGNYTLRGGAQCHILSGDGGHVYYNTDGNPGLIGVTVTGAPTFRAAFMGAVNAGTVNCQAVAFSGAAHGPTYMAKMGGILSVGTTNPNYFPGDIAGTLATGGQYA